MYRRESQGKEGCVFGLKPQSLFDWQLKKIRSEKLLEFVGTDERIKQILQERLHSFFTDENTDVSEVFSELLRKGYDI